MHKVVFFLAVISSLLGVVIIDKVYAQPHPIAASEPFSTLMARWTRLLDAAENDLKSQNRSKDLLSSLQTTISNVKAEAENARDTAKKRINEIQPLLDALGAQPGPDMPAEHPSITQKREQYQNDLADFQARRALSELVNTRAQELLRAIDEMRSPQQWSRVSERWPIPLIPTVALKGIGDYLSFLQSIAVSPFEWLRQTNLAYWSSHWKLAMMVFTGIIAGWFLRGWLLRHYGRNEAIAEPSYARRFVAAVIDGIARGLVPAGVFAVMLAQTNQVEDAFPGLFVEVYRAFWMSLIIYTLVVSLSRAALAPGQPAWQLLAFKPEQARLINRRVIWLATVGTLAGFQGMVLASSPQLQASTELQSLGSLLFNTLLGIGLISLMRQSLWEDEQDDASAESESAPQLNEETVEAESRFFWRLFRTAVNILVPISIIAAGIGYGHLSNFLMWATLLTVALAGLVFILRSLFGELLSLLLAWDWVSQPLGLTKHSRKVYRFWLGLVFESAIWLLTAFLLLLIWGVPLRSLTTWGGMLLSGMTLGNVTISLLDIGLAIAAFVIILLLARVLQQVIVERTLVHSRMSAGARYSIGAAIRYVGVIVSVVLAIAMLGIDMTNLALVAGALSVGIGFGLQNIVNNFVSGMILLIERPIKVGDWVIVGQNEGLVKRINIRSTEVETFQMASVIIPNADIISHALTNWTHTNHYGRVDVPVGVAYGTDPQKVNAILLECAQNHPKVISWIAPFVVFMNYGPARMEFELRCFTAEVMSRIIIASELRYTILQRFKEEDIVIPLPQQIVHWTGEPPMADKKPAQEPEQEPN